MSRRVVFAEDCLKGSCFLDEQTIKQKVIDIINNSADYLEQMDEGDGGRIVDEEEGLCIKFYITEKTILK